MKRHVHTTLPAPVRVSHRPAVWRFGALSTVAGVVLGITTLSAGAAVAYIATSTTDSSHPAQALAATLAAPGAGHQDGQDKAGAVAITWTAPTGHTYTQNPERYTAA